MKLLQGGRQIAQEIVARHADLSLANTSSDYRPKLAVLHFANDEKTQDYVQIKRSCAEKFGIECCPIDVSQMDERQVVEQIEKLNDDFDIHGILIQRPLPQNIDVMPYMAKEKDVEGYNSADIFDNAPAKAIQLLLQHSQLSLNGLNITISNFDGNIISPAFTTALQSYYTEAVFNKGKTDVFITDMQCELPSHDMTGLIDLCYPGIDRVTNCEWVTKVPGGVLPILPAIVMQNTLYAAKLMDLKGEKTLSHVRCEDMNGVVV